MNKDLENKIKEALTRGVADFIDPDGTFKKKLIAKANGKYDGDVIIKFGVDPTRPDIHLGHAVCFRKLRQLQDLGCKIVFLVGDFTAMIGDPSGKDKVRPMIHLKEIAYNMKTYVSQIDKILLTSRDRFSQIVNSDWYFGVLDIEMGEKDITVIEVSKDDGKRTTIKTKGPHLLAKASLWDKSRIQNKLPEVIGRGQEMVHSVTLIKFIMAGLRHITYSQLMQRSRFKERKELYMHEMIYPVLQGIDSNVLYKIYGSCDLEVGGTDQTFNMLIGRDIMESEKQEPQSVIALKILEGIDGKEKMSQSLGNYIGITEDPNSMFGKIMSIPDNLIINYFELCTDIPMDEIKEMKEGMKDEKINPRDTKIRLAEEIVKIYHGEEKARKAKEYFVNTFSEKKIPDDIPEIKVAQDEIKLTEFLVLSKTAGSLGDARRKVEQGAVEINGKKETDWRAVLKKSDNGAIIKVGKKDFVKIVF